MTLITNPHPQRGPIQVKLVTTPREMKAVIGFARLMLKKMIHATGTPTAAASARWLNLAAIAPRLAQISTLEKFHGEWAVGHRFMIATQRGKIVGLNQFIRAGDNQLHSVITCVSPDYGGKGLGPRLHRYTWAHAIKQGMVGTHSLLVTPESKNVRPHADSPKRKGRPRGTNPDSWQFQSRARRRYPRDIPPAQKISPTLK